MTDKYTQNLSNVQERIENAKKLSLFKEDIRLIAVSKAVTSDEVKKLYDAKCAHFGENKVQALKQKCDELENLDIKWHFIGRLQTNKINQLIDLNPTLIHSCDSLELAIQIDKRLKVKNKTLDILLQINSAKEISKAGISPNLALQTYEEILKNCTNLNLKGVMSIGAHIDDTTIIQKSFETTREIYEKVVPLGAVYCSMGMSGDFELAIKCGSNMLRLGTILFKQ
ncbi:MAG: YggS family pyridoxal phosphate-dependent enzyme [Campylobacteraceae bacterium]|jgi:pyridoxal phosphate enzyme (YggS family)|nr:YggS family pyridoxal phosphate-dependent enzyme [Campylobacteraceae bacterium]